MSFYTSLTGLNSATSQLAVTSNNIANVGTTAFKRSRADFGDIFSTSPLKKASSQVGQGSLMKGVAQEFSQGNISTSGNALDMAITGDGFFAMKTADGLQDIYTRNGAFMLNDLNQVVNSAGQRLMAASVDSSGTANLGSLSVLTIPSKTAGDAARTNAITMGVNLPSDAVVLKPEDFDRRDPTTYNESTAITVYDDAGQGYLATVYYVKTQNANSTQDAKWQTFFYVGDKEFSPRLQQATNVDGQYLQMDKYGNMRAVSSPALQKYPMYRLDDNSTPQASMPATITGKLPQSVAEDGTVTKYIDENNLIDADTLTTGDTISFDLKVDGSPAADAAAVTISYTVEEGDLNADKLLPASTLASRLTREINNAFGAEDDPRYGIKVSYSNGVFQISSGTTGDNSSLELTEPSASASALGLIASTIESSTTEALRGKASDPAVLSTDSAQTNNNHEMTINDDIIFDVSIDGISGSITLPSYDGTVEAQTVASDLQDLINYDADRDDNLSKAGQLVYGVTVEYDPDTKKFVITSPSTGTNSEVSLAARDADDAALFGLTKTTTARGTTSTWTPLVQHTIDGEPAYVVVGADGNFTETTDSTGVVDNSEYWPIFLDPGELTFSSNGDLIYPVSEMPFTNASSADDSAFTISSIGVDLTRSTQSGSIFSILSQSQDGSPEGDLMGLEIGDDGLVSASFSNGSQKSLGKIILVNFSNPTGLRQMGDGSYLASASSGTAKTGEAGSSGFGSIRAGAIERSNVDLTQELVDLITAQRNFQANAKAIETSNTLTQAIINIRG